jgi:hypothetical protein
MQKLCQTEKLLKGQQTDMKGTNWSAMVVVR